MGAGKVKHCNVIVDATDIGKNDVLYTVSGDDAERLHRFCNNVGAKPSEFKEGQFTLKKSDTGNILDDNPTLSAMREELEKAANSTGVSSSSPGHRR